jgi:hypothetical protein
MSNMLSAFHRRLAGTWEACYKCAFTAYNCTDEPAPNATTFHIVTVAPWDQISGKLQGACASKVGADLLGECPGGLPNCGGRVAQVSNVPLTRFSDMPPNRHAYAGWRAYTGTFHRHVSAGCC